MMAKRKPAQPPIVPGRHLRAQAAAARREKQAALHSALAKVVARGGVEPPSTPRQEATEPAQNIPEIITEPRFTFPPYVEPTPALQPAQGTYRIHELGFEQCRFACTADDVPRDQHRFCGALAPIGPGNLHGSWCAEHLAVLFDRTSRMASPGYLKALKRSGAR